MGFWLYATRATQGGMALIRALRGRRIKPGGGKFKPKRFRQVVNWGCTQVPEAYNQFRRVLNQPDAVALCVNKSKFFSTLATHANASLFPLFTKDIKTAQEWVDGGKLVVSRCVLNGHSGDGIVLCSRKNGVALPKAPLYTLYIRKDEEYRLHFVRDKGGHPHSFYEQKKVKRLDFVGTPNRKVRCFENGYTYQHNGIEVPDVVREVASKVFNLSDLDFGAVDVIFCRADNKAYVLEINTAPGLEGHSLEVYAAAFQKYFK